METTNMRRRFSREVKLAAARAVELGTKTRVQVCREVGCSPSLLSYWTDQYRLKGEEAFVERQVHEPDDKARIKELEAALGRSHLENEFLREALSMLRHPGKRLP